MSANRIASSEFIMATLVIQSVFEKAQLLLLSDKSVLTDSAVWSSEKDEIKQLIPRIEKLLQENDLSWNELREIVSVVGVGSFSATRISVTIANILGLATEAEMFELKLKEQVSEKELQKLAMKCMSGKSVSLARPEYRTSPMISPSKKPLFNQ
jgi:tRNA A37 threonylcarbamoyladenosine modification protein TsaB